MKLRGSNTQVCKIHEMRCISDEAKNSNQSEKCTLLDEQATNAIGAGKEPAKIDAFLSL